MGKLRLETKLFITAVLLLILVMAFGLWRVNTAHAATQALHVEWDYPQGVTDLAGFRLYVNGGQVCDITDKAARVADCSGVIPDGPGDYTMTAYTASGQVSAHSAKVTFDPLPPAPAIRGVR